jgi:hypothetical protein
MAFQVGDMVRCVDCFTPGLEFLGLKLGVMYTVSDYYPSILPGGFVKLKETGDRWWLEERFESDLSFSACSQIFGHSPLQESQHNLSTHNPPYKFHHFHYTSEKEEDFNSCEELKKVLASANDLLLPDVGLDAAFKDFTLDAKEFKVHGVSWSCSHHRLRLFKVVEIEPDFGELFFVCPNCEKGSLTVRVETTGLKWPIGVEIQLLEKKVVIPVRKKKRPSVRLIRLRAI